MLTADPAGEKASVEGGTDVGRASRWRDKQTQEGDTWVSGELDQINWEDRGEGVGAE